MKALAEQPILSTERLILRPFTQADVPTVTDLAGVRQISEMTLSIPYPYTEADATAWISQHPQLWAEGKAIDYAITRYDVSLCGSVGLGLNPDHNLAELGYWIGQPYWGLGYATEAARAIVAFGFTTLELNRINATHFSDNPASGRVMEKLGMRCEGYRHRHTLKWGKYRDIKLYGLLQSDWYQFAQKG
ncbi:GNAT family N-acetyltransferase [Nodosilinea sp. P-1105]|uniref:GNAT family N-acetyltransferase n=1 Tax=Nodosilinea sp. P-1105 TaxID=2546229 RepID=UPI00146A650A|nr:GNAT family N-acetyltransferase [Nodosilinea sp. P-1105]NMF82887.1 N-acetyltransferase [Nodosilinea sp. P-1105]